MALTWQEKLVEIEVHIGAIVELAKPDDATERDDEDVRLLVAHGAGAVQAAIAAVCIALDGIADAVYNAGASRS